MALTAKQVASIMSLPEINPHSHTHGLSFLSQSHNVYNLLSPSFLPSSTRNGKPKMLIGISGDNLGRPNS